MKDNKTLIAAITAAVAAIADLVIIIVQSGC